MAKLTIIGDAELINMFNQLADHADGAAKMALYEGADILIGAVKNRLNVSLAEGQELREARHAHLTGDLMNGLGISKIHKSRKGVWTVRVGFSGYDRKGRPLPIIARALESGNSMGMKKRPFLRPAVQGSESEILSKMGEVFDKETKKITKGTE